MIPPLYAACLALLLCLAYGAAQAAPPARPRAKPVVPIRAEPFTAADVRLLDGPFKHAQELDRKYLLSLDPERLLHNFRVNAGLPSSAEPLGGWEKPDCEVRGHFTGHYLTACAMMYAATGDEALKARAEMMVAELAKCQKALKNGYLSAYPESFIDRVEARQRVWAPWYTLHKIHAGLMDVYAYCGSKQALEAARKFGDWAKARADKLDEEQMQGMLANEHGGINESMANLYGYTGDKAYLALSRRYNHAAVIDPLAKGQDVLTGLHANTQIPKFIGTARQYELTGEPAMRDASLNFWRFVAKERSYVIGGHSDGEMFTPKETLSQAFGPNTTETCNTYNMVKLTGHLFRWDPRAEYADYTERALLNHILASQHPQTGMMCYYLPLRSGSSKVFNEPLDSFWCCTGTGVENHVRYNEAIYSHDGRSALWVNQFIASTVRWAAKGVTLTQRTEFPRGQSTALEIEADKPVRLTLRIRRPAWVQAGFAVAVNGKAQTADPGPDGYVAVTRTWRSGDRVEVRLPMAHTTEGFADNPRRLAYLLGPVVLCANAAPDGPFPVLVDVDPMKAVGPVPDGALSRSSYPGAFRVPSGEPSGQSVPVFLKPLYATYERPYQVYFDVLTSAEWQARLAEERAAAERRKALDARTVDVVYPGRGESEASHAHAGEKSRAGTHLDRGWRDAEDGGWFSYEMAVQKDVPQDLVVTYWGSDAGPREFDVMVDGRKLATQKLQNDRPGKFIDVAYPLPADLLEGKQKVTVRFQALPGQMAGGAFEVRILRK